MGFFDFFMSPAQRAAQKASERAAKEEAERAAQAEKAYLEKVTKARDYSKNLANQVQDYRSNLGQTKSKAYNYAQEEERQNLAQRLAGAKQGANSRGLLYSGIRQGAEGDAMSDYAQALQQRRGDIEQTYDKKAEDMEQQAINSAGLIGDITRGASNANYQSALQARQSGLAAAGSLGGALGQIGGSYLARRSGV